MMRASTASTGSGNDAAASFGILGDFPGDGDLWLELEWCRKAFAATTNPPPPRSRNDTARLVALLGSLPLRGRHAVVRSYLASSPHRDDVLRDLFDYCFEPDEESEDSEGGLPSEKEEDDYEDEFVMIANPSSVVKKSDDDDDSNNEEEKDGGGSSLTPTPSQPPKPLNLNKFHIFQVVVVLMAHSGSAGAEMSRRYLRETSSTKYRAKILVQCVQCFSSADFTDQELWEHYQSSPSSVQNKVVEACKGRQRLRRDFLRRVYEYDSSSSGSHCHQDLIYWLDSHYFASQLGKLMEERNRGFKMRQWGAQGDAYINYIRGKMRDCQNDKLKVGSTWMALRGRMELNSMKSSHVYALMELLETYEACYVYSSARKSAREYLKGLSAKGDDVSGFVDVIGRYQIDKHLLCKLTRQERLQLAIKYVESRDWDKFTTVYDLVPRHKLPYEEILSARDGGSDAMKLWSLLIMGHRQVDDDPFFQFFTHRALMESAPTSTEKLKVFKSWTEIFFRSKPTDLSDDQVSELSRYTGGKSTSELWATWYQSYERYCYQYCEYSTVISVIAKDCRKGPFGNISGGSSRLKGYTLFAREVIDSAALALENASPHLTANVALGPILALLRNISNAVVFTKTSWEESESAAAHGLIQTGAQVITDHVVPRLGRMMQFDPAVGNSYITGSTLSFFQGTLGDIVACWASVQGVAKSLASTVLDVCAQASQRRDDGVREFAIVEEEDASTRKFAFYDFALHDRTVEACCELAQTLLLRDIATHDEGVSNQLWSLVRKRSVSNLNKYLNACCTYLPSNLLGEEKSSIIERSVAFITSTYKKTPDRWKDELSSVAQVLMKLDLLETVVDDERIPSKVQNSLLIDHAGFGNEKCRQSLRDATFAADGESRAESLTAWLAEACKTDSTSLIAEAMLFATSRLKNESGAHRRPVFVWLGQHFAGEIVQKSLEDNSVETDVHEDLCSAIISIQKNDLSRLDSVGRSVCFPSLSHSILDIVLEFDPTQPCLERRQLWANCAIRLHWELQAASGGDETLRCYDWPLPLEWVEELKSASWISLEAFEDLYPSSKSSNAKKTALLSKRVVLAEHLCKEFDRDEVFGPIQCVQMLEKSINIVWADHLPCRPLRMEGCSPDDEDITEALLARLVTLFRLSGAAWQEVELLTTVFDSSMSFIETASATHCQRASELLEVLFEIHGQEAFEIPRIAQAVDKIFRQAVAVANNGMVGRWLSRWMTVYKLRGRWVWDVPVDDRLQNFIRRYAHGCEPEACRDTMTRRDLLVRECTMVRDLLSMSTSALLLEDVHEIMLTRRQDVFLHYVRNSSSLEGVFRVPSDKHGNIDELLFHELDDMALLSCHSDISRKYARFALMEASGSRCNLHSKTNAISKFMNAPSTQHADVLDALQQSGLEDAVREALINRIFSLDSPWHILGFLLSQTAIEKNDQRVTASLLGYVAQHVHVDTVVRVVELLLKLPRRKTLSFQLHKGVVRMLFDADTQEAKQLLRSEWQNDIPDGVRSLIVEKCVQSVAAGETGTWETSVLSQVAKSQTFEPELKFSLFAPQWKNAEQWSQGAAGGIVIAKADGVSTDELFEVFQRKGPSPIHVDSGDVMERFHSILEELENSSCGSLQSLARLKKLSLSNVLAPKPRDDHRALLDMLQFLTRDIADIDHKTQVGFGFVSVLFATGACKVLIHSLGSVSDKNQQENMSNLCDQNDAVRKLRACVRAHLDAVLSLPVREQSRRKVLLKSLNSLMEAVKANIPRRLHGHDMHGLLVKEPFKQELNMLEKDAALVNAALGL